MLPSISRTKGYQTMKFGQFIECNMRNIFLEKSCIKCVGGTIPRPFYKKIRIEHISKVLYSLFLLSAKLSAIKINFKINYAAGHLLLPHIKLFKKQKV